ncbi:MAG: IS110 family RNA-guided transposase [Planctomycetota bacterium]|jgi:transposase
MSYYVGLDLHSKNTYLGILDEEGNRVYKGKVANFLELILNALDIFQGRIEGVVVESTFNWYWLVDGLMEAGYELHLANPAANKQYEGLKHSNDYHDAFHLANLLRLGILREGHIYPKNERAIRDLLRKRLMLVRHRTAHILSFQSLYNRQKGCGFRGDDVKRLREENIDNLFDSEYVIVSAKANISTLRFLGRKIEEIETVVLSVMKLLPEFQQIKTVTGIGDVLGLTISLETGDISRFSKVGNYASYCRCVESKRISNGRKKGENNRKNGNKYLSWAFVEAANFAKRYCPHARRFYQRKSAKTNKTLAIKALAHKLARASYFVMRDRVDYDPQKAFG